MPGRGSGSAPARRGPASLSPPCLMAPPYGPALWPRLRAQGPPFSPAPSVEDTPSALPSRAKGSSLGPAHTPRALHLPTLAPSCPQKISARSPTPTRRGPAPGHAPQTTPQTTPHRGPALGHALPRRRRRPASRPAPVSRSRCLWDSGASFLLWSRRTCSTRGVQAGSSAPLSWARPPRKKPPPPVSGARALVCRTEAEGAGRRLLPRAREWRGRPRPVPRGSGGASGARLGCMQVARRSVPCSSAGAALMSPRQWAWGRRAGTPRTPPGAARQAEPGPPPPPPGPPGSRGRRQAGPARARGLLLRQVEVRWVTARQPAGGCWSRARLCFCSQSYSGSWARN